MFSYTQGSTEEMFAATATDIYPVGSPADPDVVPTALRSSQTSGQWSTIQTSNAGGNHLIAVNGADTGFTYDGTTDTDISISGVASTDLSQVWLFGERAWFVEKDTLNAWYLGTEAIGGAATKFPLGAVFKKGGSLLFGANWSTGAGDGLGDKCVFVSTEGEIAVYGGNDPSDAATFGKEGLYQIGKPIDKFSSFSLGGDLMIVTGDGIIPLSAVKAQSYDDTLQQAMTEPIENDWKRVVGRRVSNDPIATTYWPTEGKLIVSTPERRDSLPVQYVANTRYNTWCAYVGWDVQCATIFNDKLYFADASGTVYQGEAGGNDNGVSYTTHYVPKFTHFGTAGDKVVTQIGLVYRAPRPATFGAVCLTDYSEDTPPIPSATTETTTTSAWGTDTWGSGTWGSDERKTGHREWKSAGATGFSIAPGISHTFNQTAAPNVEIIATLARFEVGNSV